MINLYINYKKASIENLEQIERTYYNNIFDVLNCKGIDIKLNNRTLFLIEAHSISLANARLALAQTKAKISKDKWLQLFDQEIDHSDKLWQSNFKNYDLSQPLKHSVIKITDKDTSMSQLMMFNRRLKHQNSDYLTSLINPVYYHLSMDDNYDPYFIVGNVINDMPSYFYIKNIDHHNYPISVDTDTEAVVYKKAYLADNDLDMHIEGIIQLGKLDKGIQLKIDFYAPNFISQEVIDACSYRIAISLKNIFQLADNEKPNSVQKVFLKHSYLKKVNNRH